MNIKSILNPLKKKSLFLFAHLAEIISKFTNTDNKLIIFNSTQNKYYNFNSKYLFEAALKQLHGYTFYFVINDPKLKNNLINQYGDYFISTNTLEGIFIASRAKVWITSVLETPYFVLPFIKNNQRIIYHLGHGVPLKNIALSENKISLMKYINRYLRTRLFTHVLSYSTEFTPHMKKAFRNNKINFVHIGQPRNDFIKPNKELVRHFKNTYPQISNKSKIVLYAPTWREYAQTVFFPIIDLTPEKLDRFLTKNNVIIFIRSHPFYPAIIDERYSSIKNIIELDSVKFPEITGILGVFDKLITDYSSIYLDFLCLNRPIGFIPYDFELYKKNIGFSLDFDFMAPGPKITNKMDFFTFLLSNDSDTFYKHREKVKKLINAKTVHNCTENLELIKNLTKANF